MNLTVTAEMAEVANKYLHKTAHENKIVAPKLKCLFFLKLLAKQVTAVAKTCPPVK